MRFFLLPILIILLLEADTDSVDTSSFDFHTIVPVEFSYIETRDDGTLYHFGVGFGASLEYDLFEFQISGMIIPLTKSDTLFTWSNNEAETPFDTLKYGGTFLYKLNSHWQMGLDYQKYLSVTNDGKIDDRGTTYGRMSSYGLKFTYDPLASIQSKKEGTWLLTLLVGYLDASNITYEEKKSVRYNIARREWEIQHIKKSYDLSGGMLTLGIMGKF